MLAWMRLMRDGEELKVGSIVGDKGGVPIRLTSVFPDRNRVLLDYEAPWGIATRECLPHVIGAAFVSDEGSE
ncbi:hypothetical protein [Rhodoligotrophos ferricapiens]|uniref:hypothetical protein n=1 Tax=Rhodoligotrophos ferricapiens TaxID=3069264 RepID=UPI00315D40AF